MNIDELAKKAGIFITTDWMGRPSLVSIGTNGDVGLKGTQELERFAALVAAHERNKYLDKLAEAIDLSVKAEREACAKVCLKTGIKHPQQTGQEACAAAIRARGEK